MCSLPGDMAKSSLEERFTSVFYAYSFSNTHPNNISKCVEVCAFCWICLFVKVLHPKRVGAHLGCKLKVLVANMKYNLYIPA